MKPIPSQAFEGHLAHSRGHTLVRVIKWTLFFILLGWAVFYARLLWFLYNQVPHALQLQPPGASEIAQGVVYLILVGLLPLAAAIVFLIVQWPQERKIPTAPPAKKPTPRAPRVAKKPPSRPKPTKSGRSTQSRQPV